MAPFQSVLDGLLGRASLVRLPPTSSGGDRTESRRDPEQERSDGKERPSGAAQKRSERVPSKKEAEKSVDRHSRDARGQAKVEKNPSEMRVVAKREGRKQKDRKTEGTQRKERSNAERDVRRKQKDRKAEAVPEPTKVSRSNPVPERFLGPPRNHREALERQLSADWGHQVDRDQQAAFPLADAKNWKRVRFGGVEHFTGFNYGSQKSILTSAFSWRTTRPSTSKSCLELFEAQALEQLDAYPSRRSRILESRSRWREQVLVVHSADGELNFFLTKYRFSAAWTAFPAYKDGCIVYATIVLWGDEPALARRVRDRWVTEGFPLFIPGTEFVPFRLER